MIPEWKRKSRDAKGLDGLAVEGLAGSVPFIPGSPSPAGKKK